MHGLFNDHIFDIAQRGPSLNNTTLYVGLWFVVKVTTV